MKECKYCRTKYEDNLNSCPNCGGTKVITEQEKAEDAALYQKEIENRESAVAVVATKRKLLISALVGIVVVIIAVVALVSYNANKPWSNGMTKDEGKAILAEGIAFYNNGDYESAIECFVQLPSDSKQYDEAQSMLAKCEDEYSASVVEKASGYAENGEYEMAINLLNNAENVLPNNAAISAAHNAIFAEYKEIICGDAYSEANAFFLDGDYISALETIKKAIAKVGPDYELSAKLSIYCEEYKESVIKEARIQYKSNGLNSAISVLQNAKTILGSDKQIDEIIAEYQKTVPVRITSLECYTEMGGEKNWDQLSTMIGEDYTSYPDLIYKYGDVFFEYELLGKYEYASGTLVFNGITADDGDGLWYYNTGLGGGDRKPLNTFSPTVRIYGDGELLWQGTVSASQRSNSFEIFLSDVQYLTIRIDDFSALSWDNTERIKGAISNFILQERYIE